METSCAAMLENAPVHELHTKPVYREILGVMKPARKIKTVLKAMEPARKTGTAPKQGKGGRACGKLLIKSRVCRVKEKGPQVYEK